jgi:hypothetical protein
MLKFSSLNFFRFEQVLNMTFFKIWTFFKLYLDMNFFQIKQKNIMLFDRIKVWRMREGCRRRESLPH